MLPILLAVLGPFAAAQGDPPPSKPTPEQAIAEFRKLALKQVSPGPEMAQRAQDLEDWLERVQGVDLGDHGFARAIAKYFNRDYDGAARGLFDHYAQHGTFATDDYNALIGRVFMNHVSTRLRAGEIAEARKALRLALYYWPERKMVYGLAGRLLAREESPEARDLLLNVTARLAEDPKVEPADRMQLLRQIYGGGERGNREGRGGRAAAPPRRPTTIEPFRATDMDGKPIALEDYKGKVVLVDFWATWCRPCMSEMPKVVRVYERYKSQGFEVIGVSLDKENAADKIRDVAKEHGMAWRQIYDGQGWNARLAKENGIRSIPATFLFDRNGKCRAANLRGAELTTWVAKLIAERQDAQKQ